MSWKLARAAWLAALPLCVAEAAGAATSTVDEAQPAFLAVSVNGQNIGEPVMVLRGADGTLYVPLDSARAWRLDVAGLPMLDSGGVRYVSLAGVAGLEVLLDEATQSLALRVDPDRLGGTLVSYRSRDEGPMTPSGWGAFMNYELLGEVASGSDPRLAGSLEFVAFTPHGFGTSSFIGGWSDRGGHFRRLETNWTIDDPARMRSLRLGDSISRGGIGAAPLRFGGIQFARNFAVQPGFVTFPLFSFDGSAALPSVVDVYVNDVRQGGRDVQPGPFQILDVPVVTGAGEVQLVVRDLLGRETIMRQSFYVAPGLLRPGLHDFSYEAGALRRNFGRRSMDYGDMFVAGTHRYGFSRTLTGEAHFELSEDVQQGGIAFSWLLPELGLFSGGVAASRSDRGTGALVSAGFERRSRHFSIGAAGEFATRDYTTLGLRHDRRRPAATVQAFAGLPVGFGSVGAAYIWRDMRGSPDVELVSANVSVRIPGLGFLHVAGRQGLGRNGETAVEAFLTIPIGQRSSASGGVAWRDGSATATFDLQRSVPAGEGFGYRVSARAGRDERVEGRLIYQSDFGAYDATLTWRDGTTGARLVVDGSIGLLGGELFAARRLNESFAAVRVGDVPNVRVYADNQLVGRTNANGVAIVPRLRPYERNRIRIASEDLPMDAELVTDEQAVRPPARSGVNVAFAAPRGRGAIVHVVLEDGAPLPAGAVLRIDGAGEREFVAAPGGDAFLAGLAATNEVTATWAGGLCRFPLALPAGDDPQPDLGRVTCRRVE